MQAKQIALRIPFILVLALITYASLMPMPAIVGPTLSDKVLHFVGYAGICFIGFIGFHTFGWRLTVFVILWGIGIEIAQIPVPGRLFEWLDIVANSIGALAGWGAFVVACGLLSRFK
ncbi:MAG: VanZ family protein [Pontibacterium sp.]